jgi:hypothetical protein
MDARTLGRDHALAIELGLVAGAQTAFALAVAALTGEPPAPIATIGYGVILAVALALQRRAGIHDDAVAGDRAIRTRGARDG